MADDIPTLGKSAAKIKPFVNFIQVMRSKVEIISVSELLQEIIDETGYVKELEAEDTEEAKARIENIDELISKVVAYEEGEEHPTLSGFLEEVALVADIDSLDEGSDYVVLMTLHSAKGLEFPKFTLPEWRMDCSQVICPSLRTVLLRISKRSDAWLMWGSREPKKNLQLPVQDNV